MHAGPDSEQRVFVARSEAGAAPPSLATAAGEGGKATLVIYANGDKYIGGTEAGAKSGNGMYIYADGSAYKGVWAEDALDSEQHPVMDGGDEDRRRLNELNVWHADEVIALKAKIVGQPRLPPAVMKIDY